MKTKKGGMRMGIVERLDAMRTATRGCRLAAFGDLRTRLVLRASAEKSWPQERLDELCTLAADSVGQADGGGMAELFAGAPLDEAIVLGRDGIRLFIRPANGESDVICCVCDTAEALEPLANAARAALRDM